MSNRQNNKSGFISPVLIAALISAFVTFSGSYMTFRSDIQQSDVDLVRTFSERSEKVQEKLFAAQMRILRLEVSLAEKYGSDDAIKGYLDSLPYPAWVKLVEQNPKNPEEPKIKMWYINTAYEIFFKAKRNYYIGKTDFEVWAKSIAQGFYENDTLVLSRLASRCFPETFPNRIFDNGEMIEGFACKGAFNFKGGTALSGQILILDEHVKALKHKKTTAEG